MSLGIKEIHSGIFMVETSFLAGRHCDQVPLFSWSWFYDLGYYLRDCIPTENK